MPQHHMLRALVLTVLLTLIVAATIWAVLNQPSPNLGQLPTL